MRQRPEIEATEDMLVEAWRLLMRMPDKERGFLSAGARSGWPEVLREWWEYADAEAEPRLALNRQQVTLVERVFVDPGCLVSHVAEGNVKLMGVVIGMIVREGRVWWDQVFIRMDGKRIGVTSDGLRRRYDRTLARLAVVEAERAGAGFGALAE